MVTSPAPARNAAVAASITAPGIPLLPPTINTWPNLPLCDDAFLSFNRELSACFINHVLLSTSE